MEHEFCHIMTSPLAIKTVKERDVYDLIRKVKTACVLSLLLKCAVIPNTNRKTPFIQLVQFVYYFCVMC